MCYSLLCFWKYVFTVCDGSNIMHRFIVRRKPIAIKCSNSGVMKGKGTVSVTRWTGCKQEAQWWGSAPFILRDQAPLLSALKFHGSMLMKAGCVRDPQGNIAMNRHFNAGSSYQP